MGENFMPMCKRPAAHSSGNEVVANLRAGRDPVTGSHLSRKPVFREDDDGGTADYVESPLDLDDGDRDADGKVVPLHKLLR